MPKAHQIQILTTKSQIQEYGPHSEGRKEVFPGITSGLSQPLIDHAK